MPPVLNPIENLATLERKNWSTYAAILVRSVNGKSTADDGATLLPLANALHLAAGVVISHAAAVKESLGLVPLASELPKRKKAMENAEATAAKFHTDLCARLDAIRARAKEMRAQEDHHRNTTGDCTIHQWDLPSEQLLRTTGSVLGEGEADHKKLVAAIEPLKEPVAEAAAALSRIHALRAEHARMFEHIAMELPE